MELERQLAEMDWVEGHLRQVALAARVQADRGRRRAMYERASPTQFLQAWQRHLAARWGVRCWRAAVREPATGVCRSQLYSGQRPSHFAVNARAGACTVAMPRTGLDGDTCRALSCIRKQI
jgi:hypothetical protein